LSRPRCSRSAATASLVACSPSISVTASPGSRSIVSMTTKTTPSRTGTASRRRRTTNVSIRRNRGAPRVARGAPNAGGIKGAHGWRGGGGGGGRGRAGGVGVAWGGGGAAGGRGGAEGGGGGGAPRVARGAPNAGGIEERHGLPGALRTLGGMGGHVGAPHLN